MKVLLINSWFRQYSTGKLVGYFYDYLKQNNDIVKVYYGHGEQVNESGVKKISSKIDGYIHAGLSRVTGYQGCFSNKSTRRLIKEIQEYKPDVVYLFNLHAYYLNEYMLLEHLKSMNIKVIYMLFDEYPYLGKCCFSGTCTKFEIQCKDCPDIKGYPKSLYFDRSKYLFNKKKSIFKDWDNIIFAGVEFLAVQAKKSMIAKNIKFNIIDMGVQLEKIYFPRDSSELRKKLAIPDNNKVVITVGPYSDERKGIKKFIEIARILEDKEITFINIGFDGKNTKLPKNFLPIPYISNQDELAIYYSMADIYAMTSSGEAMSLTCMEALGCGTRLVGFNISGTPYAANEVVGNFVEYDNLNEFANIIEQLPIKTTESINRCRLYALSRYEISDYVKNLYNIAKK